MLNRRSFLAALLSSTAGVPAAPAPATAGMVCKGFDRSAEPDMVGIWRYNGDTIATIRIPARILQAGGVLTLTATAIIEDGKPPRMSGSYRLAETPSRCAN